MGEQHHIPRARPFCHRKGGSSQSSGKGESGVQGNEELTAPAGRWVCVEAVPSSAPQQIGEFAIRKALVPGAPCTEPSQGCSQSQAQRGEAGGSGLLGHTQGSSWSPAGAPREVPLGLQGWGKTGVCSPSSSCSSPAPPPLPGFLYSKLSLLHALLSASVCHPHLLSLPPSLWGGSWWVGGGTGGRSIVP